MNECVREIGNESWPQSEPTPAVSTEIANVKIDEKTNTSLFRPIKRNIAEKIYCH